MPRLSKIGAAALAAFGWTSGATVSVSYLVVAGGGGGGGNYAGGGGGGGGILSGSSFPLNPTLSYVVTVGAGGNNATNGTNSSFSSFTALGGGFGTGYGSPSTVGNGGCGGGGATSTGTTSSGGTGSQGGNGGLGYNNGGYPNGGGGGGGSANGSNAGTAIGGNGGVGTASSISGLSVYYAGGGGGGADTRQSSPTQGTGGNGGGANATLNATSNTGGGGGGGNSVGTSGGFGGSGIVIISYPAPQKFGGGVVTASGSNIIHTFTTSGTLTPLTSLSASYLIVAGGGGGAGGNGAGTNNNGGGAGGGGGLLTGSGLTIDTNSNYVVVVGAGGNGGTHDGSPDYGSSGSNSSFSIVTTTAIGGGRGGGRGGVGQTGGSGGGGGGGSGSGTGAISGGSATSGQGYAGGSGYDSSSGSQLNSGGGGGGANAIGTNATSGGTAGNGGSGIASSISGSSVTYAGGGGGGATSSGTAGTGGTGGGGSGTNSNTTATSGTANLGGGGGGGGGNGTAGGNGGAGGSGIVIISYPGSTQQMAGGTVTIVGGNVIHTFTSSGYLTPIKYVNNSLRFRSSASAYLNRTPGSASNRKTFTWSAWIKRGIIGSTQYPLGAGTTASDYSGIAFASDNLYFVNQVSSALTINVNTVAVFRDPSSWYHVLVAIDTTQSSSSNGVKIWINGTQQTLTYTTYTQNTNCQINNTTEHDIGRTNFGAGSNYFDGYLTEINFIDGQALTPTSFGAFNSYGVWQPISYGGSYGTNGFYLPFTNKTSTTTLGYDFSPNGNNWTTNNISLTAGSTYDSMTDVPTLTSATASNYCVLNPLQKVYGNPSNTNGNLTGTSSSGDAVLLATMGITSGKFYAECTATAVSGGLTVELRDITGSSAVSYTASTGAITGTSAGATYTTGDVIGIAYDFSAQTVAFYKNNALQGTSTGVSQSLIWTFGNYIPSTSNTVNWNFGQQGFKYTPPTGFVALNTYNL